jgi:peptidylprolyl isomerase
VACSGDGGAVSVEVGGEPGTKPVVTYVPPLAVSSTYRRTILEGTGPELVEDQPVLFDFYLEDATDATVVQQSYDTQPLVRDLSREALGEDLFQTLRGQRVGARLLQVAPAPKSGQDRFPSVTVIDVLPLRADGESMPPRDDVALPAVTLAANGAPSIAPTGTDPPTTVVVQPLIRGTGTQVAAQDTVTFQYAIFTWAGEPIDSSWDRGQPESQSLGYLASVLSDWLVDQPVGSQIEIVVPPTESLQISQSQEYKGQTFVLVLDILSTRTPAGGP